MDFISWLITFKAAIILGIFLVFFVLERVAPVSALAGGAVRVLKNLGVASLNFIASPLIVLPITYFAAAHAPGWRPEQWSGVAGLLLDVVILDCWIYWWHRLNHAVPFLWRWHEVHHLDETLDTTTAVRFHVGEVIMSSLVRAAVIWALGMPLQSVLVFEVLVTSASIFQHSNVTLPPRLERILSWFIVTPSIHWVHHHAIRRDTDSNYSNILSLWDRLFGSASQTIRTPEMPIGVEGRRDLPFARLLQKPLRELITSPRQALKRNHNSMN